MKRPLIGLSGRRKKGSDIVGNITKLAHLDIDMYYSDYARGVLEAGGMPIHLPIDIDPGEALEYVDALVLSGGADIGPDRYGREPETDLYPAEVERDAFELGLLDRAVADQTPTLGICRGLQMVNVHGGGTLHQHVPEHAAFDHPPTTEWHKVAFEDDSVLGGLYGATRAVNSLHHQTVDTVAPGFRVTGRSDDGSVEGLEHHALPIVAVQWHPEMLPTRASDPIFGWLVEAARG